MQSFKRFLVRFIVLTFFLAWTVLLGSETWAVQQTCNPMIEPVQESELKAFNNRCEPPPPPPPSCPSPKTVVGDECVYPCSSGKTRVNGECVCPNADMAGVGGAALAAGGAAAVAAPPILVLLGIAIAAWWVTRTVVKAITCN